MLFIWNLDTYMHFSGGISKLLCKFEEKSSCRDIIISSFDEFHYLLFRGFREQFSEMSHQSFK